MVKKSSSDFEHSEWVCWADSGKMNLPDRISPFLDLSKDVCTKVERDVFAPQLTLAWLAASSGFLTRQSKWCAVEQVCPHWLSHERLFFWFQSGASCGLTVRVSHTPALDSLEIQYMTKLPIPQGDGFWPIWSNQQVDSFLIMKGTFVPYKLS